jgi:transcriptional regulator with XRE-family HTH domain
MEKLPQVFKERIARNLVYLREVRELSQSELAKKMGEIQSHISDIERGKRISLDFLYRYHKYYGLPRGFIIDHDLRENKEVLLKYLLDQSIDPTSANRLQKS